MPAPAAHLAIFICYRRADTSGEAVAFSDKLNRRRGFETFKDVDSIRPGQDWIEAVEGAVAKCDVLLVLIGPDWTRTGAAGHGLDENDRVRREIEAALTGKKAVIPVLFDSAALPDARDLPESLRPLLRRHSIRIRNSTFNRDLEELIAQLKVIARAKWLESQTVEQAGRGAAVPTVAVDAAPRRASLPPPPPPPPTQPRAESKPSAEAGSSDQPPEPVERVSDPRPPPSTSVAPAAATVAAAGSPPPPPPLSRVTAPLPRPVAASRGRRPAALAPIGLIGAGIAILVIALVVANGGFFGATPPVTSRPSATAPPSAIAGQTVKIGIELPQSGDELAIGEPIRNGVLLAIEQANQNHTVPDYTLADNNQDDAVNGVHNSDKGRANMATLVADTAVLGVVGPLNSSIARVQIPVSNQAGLAQCSPTTAGTDLTQAGYEQYASAHPDKRNYFRVAAPDSVLGPAMANYDFTDLGKQSAYVVDDTTSFGVTVADLFEAEFQRLGGTVVRRDGLPKSTTDYTSYFATAEALNADVVFFGGLQLNGGGLARKQMVAAGMAAIPFTGTDGIADLAPGGNQDAFITLAGVENSDNVYGAVAGLHDLPSGSTFAADYQAKFGKAAGAFSAAGYACAQVIIKAIGETATAAAGDLARWRAAVRDYIFDASAGHEYDTAMGRISFNACGDIEQAMMSFYKVDQALNDGKGGWVFVKQQAFLPGGC